MNHGFSDDHPGEAKLGSHRLKKEWGASPEQERQGHQKPAGDLDVSPAGKETRQLWDVPWARGQQRDFSSGEGPEWLLKEEHTCGQALLGESFPSRWVRGGDARG